MQEKNYKSCAQFINRGNKIVNRAHDLAYYCFPACHVRGSVALYCYNVGSICE